MADYNIYIHSVENSGTVGGSGANFNPTIPWGNEENGNESEQLSKETPNFQATTSKASALVKASPWLAIAYAVAKVTYQVAKTATEFWTIESGDYRSAIAFNNFESTVHSIFHPLSTTVQEIRQRKQNRVENQRRSMQRELLGDSEINHYTNRGF